MSTQSNSQARLVVIALLGAIAAFVGGWLLSGEFAGDFKTIRLTGGREIVVLRDFQRVFPVYGKSVKAELDLALKEKAKILDASGGGKYQSDVEKFYKDLDAISNDVRTALVSAYFALVTKISAAPEPSQTAAAFEEWDRILEMVIREAFNIRSINQQLAAVQTMTSGTEWEKLFELGEKAVRQSGALTEATGDLPLPPE